MSVKGGASTTSVASVEAEVVSEVPDDLKKLVRYVTRGFYNIEHALTMDLLIHQPCIKEDDMLELLKFERKQLRTVINTLKNDKFVRSRMRVETDADGKTMRHNYYFINYNVFVNVVKYRLDHMRRKIETQERDATNRACYRCPSCEKTFTDLEADQLFDPASCAFHCTHCGTEVEEEASSLPKTDARTLMVHFNEQMAPLFTLLRAVEDVKLAADLLEPEPRDINTGRADRGATRAPGEKSTWSGDATKYADYGMYQNHEVTINMEGEQAEAAGEATRTRKERPVWMVESTIEGAASESFLSNLAGPGAAAGRESRGRGGGAASKESEAIMQTLLAHEPKTAGPQVSGVAASDNETSTSESEDEAPTRPTFTIASVAAEMESSGSDNDDDTYVTVCGERMLYQDVTPQLVARMLPHEKEEYIRVGQQMYQHMYD